MKTLLLLLFGFVVLLFAYPVLYWTSTETVIVTITDKERVVSDNESKYLIFTENLVMKNTDSWLFLKFNSSDIYGKLKIGETYKIKKAGWRNKFLSWYPNIISVEKYNTLKDTSITYKTGPNGNSFYYTLYSKNYETSREFLDSLIKMYEQN